MNYKILIGVGIVIIVIFIIISNQEPSKITTQNSTSISNNNSTVPSQNLQGKQLQLTLSDSVGIKAK